MNHPAQQTSFIPAAVPAAASTVAEGPPVWEQLVVPVDQTARLQSGGATYIADFITPDEEDELLAAVDCGDWETRLQRNVQHYGYRYDYTERGIDAANRLGPLPAWAAEMANRLVRQNLFQAPPGQLIVNEYRPGQGIAPHTDRDCFGPAVASLSLAGDCLMKIIPHGKNPREFFEIVLKRRSLLVFQGESREVWLHGIAPRKTDRQYGHKIPRQRRVSLTFRTVKTAR